MLSHRLINALFIFFSILFYSDCDPLSDLESGPDKADLICRNCGRKIANEEAFIDVKSNKALKSFNTTILGLKTLVHIFENQVPKRFNVITVKGASVKLDKTIYTVNSWFTGTQWTICKCVHCDYHVGWYFTSSKKKFIGLILENLISSTYADSLTLIPKLHIDL